MTFRPSAPPARRSLRPARVEILPLVRSLAEAGCPVVLGGSGLLASLGLIDRVRDWDLVTDAPVERVLSAVPAFRGWSGSFRLRARQPYASWFFLRLTPVPEGAPDAEPGPSSAGRGSSRASPRPPGGLCRRPVDLIGGFAIRTASGICQLPALQGGTWEGVPTASPEVWLVAYRLLNRHDRADLLAGYLRQHGAAPDCVARMLREPLPGEVRRELESLLDSPRAAP